MKNIRILSENVEFLVVKFSIYLNRRVFVMKRRIKINVFLISHYITKTCLFKYTENFTTIK